MEPVPGLNGCLRTRMIRKTTLEGQRLMRRALGPNGSLRILTTRSTSLEGRLLMGPVPERSGCLRTRTIKKIFLRGQQSTKRAREEGGYPDTRQFLRLRLHMTAANPASLIIGYVINKIVSPSLETQCSQHSSCRQARAI